MHNLHAGKCCRVANASHDHIQSGTPSKVLQKVLGHPRHCCCRSSGIARGACCMCDDAHAHEWPCQVNAAWTCTQIYIRLTTHILITQMYSYILITQMYSYILRTHLHCTDCTFIQLYFQMQAWCCHRKILYICTPLLLIAIISIVMQHSDDEVMAEAERYAAEEMKRRKDFAAAKAASHDQVLGLTIKCNKAPGPHQSLA